MANTKVGRRSIFRDKTGGGRVQGELTAEGLLAFASARVRLAKLSGRELSQVSDADTIEFLARGRQETRRYMLAQLAAAQ